MTRSELIERIAERQGEHVSKDTELAVNAVKMIIDILSAALAKGQRIEIRGFGSFELRYRAPRVGRNPKTGSAVDLTGRYVPHFKPGKGLRMRVNDSLPA